jgi:hypothetical protein
VSEIVRSFPQRIFALRAPWQDWIFVPLFVQWAVVCFVLYPAYPSFLFDIGTFHRAHNVIFPYTWISSLLLFVYALWLFAFRYRLDYVRSVAYSMGLTIAATSVFEIVYQNVGIGVGVGNQAIEGQLINLSSIGLALASVRFWRASRPFLFATMLFLSGWLLWLALGYPQIYNPSTILALRGYALNATLKVGAYVVMALMVSLALPLKQPTDSPPDRASAGTSTQYDGTKVEAKIGANPARVLRPEGSAHQSGP